MDAPVRAVHVVLAACRLGQPLVTLPTAGRGAIGPPADSRYEIRAGLSYPGTSPADSAAFIGTQQARASRRAPEWLVTFGCLSVRLVPLVPWAARAVPRYRDPPSGGRPAIFAAAGTARQSARRPARWSGRRGRRPRRAARCGAPPANWGTAGAPARRRARNPPEGRRTCRRYPRSGCQTARRAADRPRSGSG